VTWTIADKCYAGSTYSATFTINETPAPVLVCAQNMTVSACQTQAEVDAAYAAWLASATMAQGCNAVMTNNSGDAPTAFLAGTKIVTFTVTSDCGAATLTCTATFTVLPCVLCTYTQGYYGNAGGKSSDGTNTYTTAGLIEHSIASYGGTMTIGLPGHSVLISTGSASCVIARMPGGSGIGILPAGNISICNYNLLSKQGRITNKLLAQTIALGLNLGIGTPLGSLDLTQGWIIEGGAIVKIDQSVIDAIIGDKTVAGLFDLANRALGGQTVGVSLTAIAGAVDMINNAFDGCRKLLGYTNLNPSLPQQLLPIVVKNADFSNNVDMKVYPNPFSDKTTFEFTSAYEAHAILEIHNILGQKVVTLVDRIVKEGVLNRVEYQPLNQLPGIYMYRLMLDNTIQTGKIVYTRND